MSGRKYDHCIREVSKDTCLKGFGLLSSMRSCTQVSPALFFSGFELLLNFCNSRSKLSHWQNGHKSFGQTCFQDLFDGSIVEINVWIHVNEQWWVHTVYNEMEKRDSCNLNLQRLHFFCSFRCRRHFETFMSWMGAVYFVSLLFHLFAVKLLFEISLLGSLAGDSKALLVSRALV